jgi:hypothetical protein
MLADYLDVNKITKIVESTVIAAMGIDLAHSIDFWSGFNCVYLHLAAP